MFSKLWSDYGVIPRGLPRTESFVVMVRRSLKVRPLRRVANIRSWTLETLILLLKYLVAVEA